MKGLGAIAAAAMISLPLAASVTIDYPEDESIFPPDMTAPLFSWRDDNPTSTSWQIEVTFAGGTEGIRVESKGPPPQIGEIDPRCVSDTNERPELTPEEARSHTWRPDEKTWETIRKHAVERPATVTIAGLANSNPAAARHPIRIQISKDPVGAPIFYRDVPLMPSENAARVISPLAKTALPLINWRLRNVSEPGSRLLLQDMPTCANCHSFSADGKTLGMDLDGPLNDKSMYALAPVAPQMTIRDRDVIRWDPFAKGFVEKWKGSGFRIGFMSRVSPDGNNVVTTLKSQIYTANFKNYRFLQVFFPTRGILGWYNRSSGLVQTLPGADDPLYVHAGVTWSPDGTYLLFSRAEAKEAYPEGQVMAAFANDPNELSMQYDLYRLPFNAGKGGKAEPVAGASKNGKSNSFPKVSPDGRWIVYVQCRNGFLMRPDSELYIVPAEGGTARRMRCNTKLMNSWHSFSPNGRWLVFSSKSRGPYTKMFLTHIDPDGNDSPALLIENSTAANRAVNIPEFVNIAADGLMDIDVPAAETYRHFNLAEEARKKDGPSDEAIAQFRKALEIEPDFAIAHNNLGFVLAARGQNDEAIAHFRKAVELNPTYAEAYKNLGVALAGQGQVDEAIAQYEQALRIKPGYEEVHFYLGNILTGRGQVDDGVAHYQEALRLDPGYAEAHNNLGGVLAGRGQMEEAIAHFRKAAELEPESGEFHTNLGNCLASCGRVGEALACFRKAAEVNPQDPGAHFTLGNALAGQGQFDEAMAQYQQALQLRPDDAAAHNNFGKTLEILGHTGEALTHFQKAVELDPQSASAHFNLGSALAGRGQLDEAIAHFERVLELSPDEAEVHQSLGTALASRGRSEEAAIHLRKAQELKGRNP